MTIIYKYWHRLAPSCLRCAGSRVGGAQPGVAQALSQGGVVCSRPLVKVSAGGHPQEPVAVGCYVSRSTEIPPGQGQPERNMPGLASTSHQRATMNGASSRALPL